MGIVNSRREITFPQLCAIARMVFLKDPSISDSEWKAVTLLTLGKQGYANPAPESLAHALTRVEQALKRTVGPRPDALAPGPVKASQKPDIASKPTSAEWSRMVATVRQVLDRSAVVIGGIGAPATVATLEITEHAALDQFYAEAAIPGADRLAAMKRFAELAIARPSTWDMAAIRAVSRDHLLRAEQCFACSADSRRVVIDWHHVIQIQHGGSNLLRNRVALCVACHGAIHPWLPKQHRSKPGWTSVASMIDTVEVKLLKEPA